MRTAPRRTQDHRLPTPGTDWRPGAVHILVGGRRILRRHLFYSRRPLPHQPDPDTLARLQQAAPNRAARTYKQQRDAERVRVRLDVLPLIKEVLERVAADLGTSSSQAGAYLLATALIAYLQDQPEVPCVPSRSPRVAASVDLGPVLETLATSADPSK